MGEAVDTSGFVRRPGFAKPLQWSDLDPFEQGCVRRALEEAHKVGLRVFDLSNVREEFRPVRFSDLHPDTLAGMLKDGGEVAPMFASVRLTEEDGRRFWSSRQNGFRVGADPFHGRTLQKPFPPLALSLDDSGKVVASVAPTRASPRQVSGASQGSGK